MNVYRTVLWWLILAALGALAWDLLTPDLGEVLIRWHGKTITTTMAFVLIAWALLWFFLWVFWALLRLPFTTWKQLAHAQSRKRLINGLTALEEGHLARAEALLGKAAEDSEARTVALIAARRAALQHGDFSAASKHLSALTDHDPQIAAIYAAESLLADKKPHEALVLLQTTYTDKKRLPPHVLYLLSESLQACGRTDEATELLATFRGERDE